MNAPAQIEKGYGPVWHQVLQQTGWWHSFELPDGSVVKGVNSLDSLKNRIAQFPIPADLRGKRVLDIGAWDGWFSFEMERRGADVVALDCWDNPRFHEMHSIYNSRVELRKMDVMDISPATVGRFDIVLFFGVLYHLKHPLMALEKVCSITTDLAAVDSFVIRDNFDPKAQPVLEFYENDEMEGQTDNWCAPNLACLMAMCRTAGFARVEFRAVLPYSACLACSRRWSPPDPNGPKGTLLSAFHGVNGGINFDSSRDEYVMCGFRTSERDLKRQDVQPSIGPYGVQPITVKSGGDDIWYASFKLPPGLEPGWHPVSVAVRGGPVSTSGRVAVDLPVSAADPRIEGVSDGATWQSGAFDPRRGNILSIWCSGLPDNADRNNVRVFLDKRPCTVEFVEDASGPKQINVRVPESLKAGSVEVLLQFGNASAPPVRLQVL